MTTKTDTLPNTLNASALHSVSFVSLIIALLSTFIFSFNAKADDRYERNNRHDRYEQVRPNTHQSYQYIYYPAEQVYYAPHTRQWYWNSGNRWQSAYYAPAYLNLNLRVGGIPINLQTSLPYQEHTYVARQYNYAWNQDRRRYSHYAKEKNYRKQQSHQRHYRHDD